MALSLKAAFVGLVVCLLVVHTSADLCSEYCDAMTSACAGPAGTNTSSPFLADDPYSTCIAACSTYPSDVSLMNDTTGNSVYCRHYHAIAATNPNVTGAGAYHCKHASPLGGGVCGSTCEAYCNVMTNVEAYNALGAYPFSGVGQCLTFCNNYFQLEGGAILPPATTGNNAECRAYHAYVGYQYSIILYDSQVAHYRHALPGSDSYVCVNSDVDTSYSAIVNVYCDTVLDACNTTGLNPVYGQYSSRAQCLVEASYFGRGLVNDVGGNTIDCRLYHAGVSRQASTHDTHCEHSGLNGKATCTAGHGACDSYCTVIQNACNDTNAQFGTMDKCLAWCATYIDAGQAAERPYATSGNSIQCRLYHASVAGTANAAGMAYHCPHAGPTGGDACGSQCEALCAGIQSTCGSSGTLSQFATVEACVASCALYPTTGTFGITGGNTIQCRQYHAEVASQSGTLATGHCAHTGVSGGNGVCGTACQSYCNIITKGCTGSNLQYTNEAQCLAMCGAFPVGSFADQGGDTLGCRLYHANVAATGDATAKIAHCPHAGPGGGGVCGASPCLGFCDVQAYVCTGANTQFSNYSSCVASCASFPITGSMGATTGDSLQCRSYHLGVASANAAAATAHCAHTGANPSLYCYDLTTTAVCGVIQSTCGTSGVLSQFPNTLACMGALSFVPLGTAADISDDTLGCRRYHAGVAATSAANSFHCAHAGLTPQGLCGTNCQSFCDLNLGVCMGSNAQWTNHSLCVEQCNSFAAGSVGATSGNSLACRFYHTGVAAGGAAAAIVHCPHTGVAPSAGCVAALPSSTATGTTTGTTGTTTTTSTATTASTASTASTTASTSTASTSTASTSTASTSTASTTATTSTGSSTRSSSTGTSSNTTTTSTGTRSSTGTGTGTATTTTSTGTAAGGVSGATHVVASSMLVAALVAAVVVAL